MNGHEHDEGNLLLFEVIDLLTQADYLPEQAQYVVLAAFEDEAAIAVALGGQAPPATPSAGGITSAEEPVGAFLKSISVCGFRGIGSRVELELHPTVGLTVVAGRNGSGKSSFSEALEFAITGNTYRWSGKKSLTTWTEYWRNLHNGVPCEVVVELAEEHVGVTKVGVTWEKAADLGSQKTWVQRPGKPRGVGIASLGWGQAAKTYRPILSYDELGGLLEATPSTLFDRLDAILGLDRFKQAQESLTAAVKALREPDTAAKAAATVLKKDLAAVEDERAVRALTILRKHVPNLDEMQALATGTAAQPPAELRALRALTELRAPASDAVTIAVTRLQQARDSYPDAGTVTVEQAERRADLLQRTLAFHQHADDGKCPVCGIGDLDAAWRQRAEQEVAAEREEISRRRRARQELDDASGQAVALIRSVQEPAAPQCATSAFPAAQVAWRRWHDLSADPTSMIEELPAAYDELAGTFGAVSKEAEQLLAEREDAWAPLAVRLAEWVSLARKAAAAKPVVSLGVAALNFMTEAGKTLRQKRLAEVEQRARQIWAALRQDSNVDLGGIELTGTGTRRHVELHAAVDGSDAKALGVMSQGELHALALALFLPRATMSGSPFRFIVLDDPIQAMDPTKVDGFVRVLTELARSRQVIVFSHDDRLPQVIRQLGVAARIKEVCRDTNSQVSVVDCEDPAKRCLDDAFALANDDRLPGDVLARVLPNLCRAAVEVTARDRYFATRLSAGDDRVTVETTWQGAKKTGPRLTLAVHGNAGTDISPWLDRDRNRRLAYNTVTKAVHQGLSVDPIVAVRQVESLVDDIRDRK